MSDTRMTSRDRKEAIVKATLPLFAQQGFATTTTKQLAAAAGVSEALLYKHFPSKESLYQAIKEMGSKEMDEDVGWLYDLEPSTSTLVSIVYALMKRFMSSPGQGTFGWQTRTRLFMHSCLEDGSFLRFLFKHRFIDDLQRIEQSFKAAQAAGDLVDRPTFYTVRLLFCHQMAIMVSGMHLPEKPAVDYGCPNIELVNQATLFCLRGLGLKEEVIARHFDPHALATKAAQRTV